MTERLAVVGGDAGGMSAAAQARRRRPPDDLEIVAYERGRFTSYSACGIPYWLGDVVDDREALIARSPEQHRERGIDVRIRHEVVGVDLDRREVRVRDLESGTEGAEGFDQLVLAPGAVPFRPDIDGIDGEGILGVQTLEHGDTVARELERRPERGVVVGAGYIGIEMAEALSLRGVDVTIVEAGEQPMRPLDPDMGALVADSIRESGIALRLGARVAGFDLDGGRVRAVVTEGGDVLEADIVILGLGVRPDVSLALDAGLEVGDAGGVVVDRRCQTSAEGVWAAGDCTEKFHRISRRGVALALGTHANKQGRVVGINIGGGYATFPGVVGTAATKVCSTEVAMTGLTEAAAADAGFGYVTATVESTTRASYYPGACPLTVKIVAEERSGRLLGAQIVGEEGAGKRIDALATALWNEMTVDDTVNLDLSYAPPFAPLWDPVLIAARKAWQAVEAALPDA